MQLVELLRLYELPEHYTIGDVQAIVLNSEAMRESSMFTERERKVLAHLLDKITEWSVDLASPFAQWIRAVIDRNLAQETRYGSMPEDVRIDWTRLIARKPLQLIIQLSNPSHGTNRSILDVKSIVSEYFDQEVEWFALSDSLLVVFLPLLESDNHEADETDAVQGVIALMMNEAEVRTHVVVGRRSEEPKLAFASFIELIKLATFVTSKYPEQQRFDLMKMTIEQLVCNVPASQVAHLKLSLGHLDAMLVEDAELVTTLRTFLNLDCNVSSTAKELFIHRNTLLYRLDRIKQITHLDARVYRDAVRLQAMMTLYKLTN